MNISQKNKDNFFNLVDSLKKCRRADLSDVSKSKDVIEKLGVQIFGQPGRAPARRFGGAPRSHCQTFCLPSSQETNRGRHRAADQRQ